MKDAVLVRFPPDLAEAVTAVAAAENLSTAAWLRALAVAALRMPGEARRPSRQRRPLSPDDVIAVATLREAVGLTVEALVRFPAFTREQGNADTHAEVDALIRALRKHALELDVLKARLLAYPLVSK